jgi:hypothetical protein
MRKFVACTSDRLRWSGHVARVGDVKNAYKVLVDDLKGKYY